MYVYVRGYGVLNWVHAVPVWVSRFCSPAHFFALTLARGRQLFLQRGVIVAGPPGPSALR